MTTIKPDPNPSKVRVSKSDWLAAALDVLKNDGIEAVRVERLAAKLGVSKSGFYYHFKDKSDLHQKMMDYWLGLDASPILREQVYKYRTPQARLRVISEIVEQSELNLLDSAMRQWARRDRDVRRVWRREMKKRLAHIRSIFSLLGFEGDDLEMRVRVFVSYQLSEQELFFDLSKKDRDRLRDLRIALLSKAS